MEKHAGDVTLFLTSARRQRGKKKKEKLTQTFWTVQTHALKKLIK